MRKPCHHALFFLAPAIFFFTGCGDNSSTSGDEEAPALPPATSMDFDFSAFDEGTARSGAPCDRFHWGNAALRVALVNLQVAAWITPPARVFAAALQQEPMLQEDESYLWTYSWDNTETEQNPDYTVHLTGMLEGVHVNWELRVNAPYADPALDDAVWFYGQSSIHNTSGFWVFNDVGNIYRPEVARINWDFDGADRSLTFESIYESDEHFGDTLSYVVTGTIHSVIHHDASDNRDADVTWDRATHAGSLTVPDYNAGDQSCWDADLCDVECPGPPLN